MIFGKNGRFDCCEFVIYGDNNTICFGDNCIARNVQYWIEDSNNQILVGSNTSFTGKAHLAVIEGTRIEIGDDCLFSSDIVLRTGDAHSIVDVNGTRINYSKSIMIKNHCWIGQNALINKGSLISANSIVGSGSIVTKTFDEENVEIAGVPARIVKRGVNWLNERE